MARVIEIKNDVDTSLDRIVEVIYYLVGIVNIVLLLRLIFKVFGANPASGIVALIYSISNSLLVPFQGIFEIARAGQAIIEPSVLVAMLVYSLLARGIVELIYIIVGNYRRREEI